MKMRRSRRKEGGGEMSASLPHTLLRHRHRRFVHTETPSLDVFVFYSLTTASLRKSRRRVMR